MKKMCYYFKMLKENPQGCQDEVKALDISAKTPNKGKTKNASRLLNEKKICSRGKTKKEAPALKQSSGMDAKYSPGQHKYVQTSRKDLPLVDVRDHSSIDCSTIKISSSLVGQTSGIPDLNSSSSTLFQQSFTDLQQVQLRAQIFVYGALMYVEAFLKSYIATVLTVKLNFVVLLPQLRYSSR